MGRVAGRLQCVVVIEIHQASLRWSARSGRQCPLQRQTHSIASPVAGLRLEPVVAAHLDVAGEANHHLHASTAGRVWMRG